MLRQTRKYILPLRNQALSNQPVFLGLSPELMHKGVILRDGSTRAKHKILNQGTLLGNHCYS